MVAFVLLIVAVLPVLFTEAPIMWAMLGNGVLWILLSFAVVGIIVGHLLGGPDLDNRRVLALATSARHPALALGLTTLNFPERAKEVMAVILFHLLVGAIVAIPYSKWCAKRRVQSVAG
jgi:BASS family bile acid:Na+ symporter